MNYSMFYAMLNNIKIRYFMQSNIQTIQKLSVNKHSTNKYSGEISLNMRYLPLREAQSFLCTCTYIDFICVYRDL